jgi:hypothetical protein
MWMATVKLTGEGPGRVAVMEGLEGATMADLIRIAAVALGVSMGTYLDLRCNVRSQGGGDAGRGGIAFGLCV